MVPPSLSINPEMMQMPPPDMPLMQGPPPDARLAPPSTFGPPGTQGWSGNDFCTYFHICSIVNCNSYYFLANMTPLPTMLHPPPNVDKQLPSLLTLKVDPPEQLMESNTEVVLPQALEDVLALKNQRALELGTDIDGGNENRSVQKNVDKESSVWEKDDNIVSNEFVS